MSKQADPRKVALVTGGGTGIGRAVSLALAARSIDVAVNYSRSEKEASATVTDIEALDVKGLAVRANVANDDEVRAMLQEVISRFGRLDYLVNCAGKTVYVDMADLEGMKPEYWDQIMDVNVKDFFRFAVLPLLISRQPGEVL